MRDKARMIESGTIGNTTTPVMAHNRETIVSNRAHRLDQSGSHLALRRGGVFLAVRRTPTGTITWQIGDNDGEIDGQQGSNFAPH